MTSKSEIWKAHPDIPGIQVSTLGRVRTLDRVVASKGNGTRLAKGHVLKQRCNHGYLQVHISVDGKQATKKVHRLVAQAFILNPDNLPEINHKDNNPLNNDVSNLEWCTHEYNIAYREKYGTPAKDFVQKSPVLALNLDTLEVSRFNSQHEAGRKLRVDKSHINAVIKGRIKQAGGYYFKEDDGSGIEIDNDKLKSIVDGMCFTRGVFAVNLNTLEVSRFNSQSEASRALGIKQGSISNVIKGKRKQTGGFWFINADDNADDAIKHKLHEIKKIYN